MNRPELKIHAKYCIEKMLEAGADKAQVKIVLSDKYELNAAVGKMSLYRTVTDTEILLTAIKNDKKGTVKINKLNDKAIDEAAKKVVDAASSSQPDEANDISEFSAAKEFNSGNENPDFELMYKRMKNFLEYSNEKYPKVILEESVLDFMGKKAVFLNSNGTEYHYSTGNYSFTVVFTAKDGNKTSSFNFAHFDSKTLEKELYEMANVETVIKQAEKELETKPLPENFVGDLVITPDGLSEFMQVVSYGLSDSAIYSKTSLFTDKLNQKIASESFNVSVNPVNENMGINEFVTDDGYEAENKVLIENGVLKSYLLTNFGAKKTGYENSKSKNINFVVSAGNKSFNEIIKSVDKGILLCRFSGGEPAQNGDFSGIAKNSFYIENGEIKHALSETMVAGNFAEMLNDIKNISSERLDFGNAIMPWMHVGGITVTGNN